MFKSTLKEDLAKDLDGCWTDLEEDRLETAEHLIDKGWIKQGPEYITITLSEYNDLRRQLGNYIVDQGILLQANRGESNFLSKIQEIELLAFVCCNDRSSCTECFGILADNMTEEQMDKIIEHRSQYCLAYRYAAKLYNNGCRLLRSLKND